MAVENATGAELAKIGGIDYGPVDVIEHRPERIADYHAIRYETKVSNLSVYDVADPRNPIKLTAPMDSHSVNFVRDPQHLETFEIAGRHYAAGPGTAGFPIVDIIDPLSPEKNGGVGDGGDNFRALDGASDIRVVDDRLYGAVAAVNDNGVQAVDTTYLAESG